MDPRFKRNMIRVAVVHGGVILGILIAQLIRDLLRHRKPPEEIVTYVNLSATVAQPAPPAPEVVEELPSPEPPPPEPPPEAIPETPPPKKKKVVEVSKKRVKRDEMPQPEPRKKRLSEDQVREMLAPVASGPTTSQDDFPFSWYYALVKRAYYEAWKQPSTSTVPPGTLVRISIRVMRDGRIDSHRVIRASGNGVMDDSVMKAVNAVKMIKPLPDKYAGEYKDITVDFELAGNS